MRVLFKKRINVFLIIINLCLVIFAVILAAKIYKFDILDYLKEVPCRNCNVILVSLDTLGANHLPCYGYYRNTSPKLCKFAKENVFFSQSYSNASWTLPSHLSIFTALYPKHHGVERWFQDKLSTAIPTLPQILQVRGYETIFVGPTTDPTLPLDKGVARGFDQVMPIKDISTWQDGYKALLDNSLKGKSTFLFLHTYFVHAPYLTHDLIPSDRKRLFTNDNYPQIPITASQWQEWTSEFSKFFYDYLLQRSDLIPNKIFVQLEQSKNLTEAQKKFKFLSENDQDLLYKQYYFKILKEVSPAGDYPRALYDEAIVYLDQQLTSLFNLLSNKQIRNNTILIITADHGEEFMEHGHLDHPSDDLYNSVTTTPLIMYIPGIKSRKIDEMVQSVDILPTILRLVGVHGNEKFDGNDLTDLIFAKPDAKRNEYLISQGFNIDSIRNQRWKLYIHTSNPQRNGLTELYDLKSDPEEKNNIVIQHPKIVTDLSNSFDNLVFNKMNYR